MNNNNNNKINTKTVIIGAGVSGISTAVNLLKNNYDDFLIFEAMDRIGGRCHTLNYDESFIELGAQFIHGQLNNPIYYIARDDGQIEEKYNKIEFDDHQNDFDNNGINIEISDIKNCDSQHIFTTENGERINLELANKIYQISNKVVRMAENYSEINLPTKKDISVADYMLLKYNELIEEKFADDLRSDFSGQLKNLIDGMFVWRCKCENVENGCDSMFKVSLNNFNTFEELKGSQIIQTKYGYKNLLNLIIQDYSNEFNSRLNLNHSLSRILVCKHLKYNKKIGQAKQENIKCEHCLYTKQQSKIVILIKDLTKSIPQNRIIVCENIVCTMSLGYLKNNLSKLIEPVEFIPAEKLAAVSRLGFEAINKIFLVYDKPFWNDDLIGIYPINILKNSETISSKLGELNSINWFESICYFEPVKDNKKVLCAWLSGCLFSENFSSEKIAQDCTKYLRRLLNRLDISEPTSILRSSWGSNPYFNGSYSYLPLGSYPNDFKKIGNPIFIDNRPVVMFAGEATIKKFYSTVHGAYISGEREAQRILNQRRFLTKNTGGTKNNLTRKQI